MSQSPTTAKVSDAYQKGWKQLNQLIRDGRSFSGNERNCCYLNTGSGTFANISAVSGFDFSDDGRAMTLLDWDHDGDLDVWITNRTAPRVRFLRNDTPSQNHFLSLRLVGSTANRDAIGARIEVFLKGDGRQGRIKTLRAGEGFLSQSTKWLHFGLGTSNEIEKAVIRWPGGDSETIVGLEADGRYVITQGTGQARQWMPPERKVSLAVSQPREPRDDGKTNVLLSSRVPMPGLNYETSRGEVLSLQVNQRRPVLVNLWASWCNACVAELGQLTSRAEELRQAGLEVLALTVDGVDNQEQTPEDAEAILAELGFPFGSGAATTELLDRFELVLNQLFHPHWQVKLPCSILLDAEGQLAAIYQGPVEIDRLLVDVSTLKLEGEELLEIAKPFPGQWQMQPPKFNLVELASRMLESFTLEEVIAYVEKNLGRLAQERNFSQLIVDIGRAFLENDQLEEAAVHIEKYRTALKDHIDLPSLLGLLAQRFSEHGDAVQSEFFYREGLKIQPDWSAGHTNFGNFLLSLGRFDEAVQQYTEALEVDEHNPQAYNSLGAVRQKQGFGIESLSHYRQALKLRPDYPQALNNLAMAYQSHGSMEEAAGLFRQTVRLWPGYNGAYVNLAKLLNIMGRMGEARQTIQRDGRGAQRAVR